MANGLTEWGCFDDNGNSRPCTAAEVGEQYLSAYTLGSESIWGDYVSGISSPEDIMGMDFAGQGSLGEQLFQQETSLLPTYMFWQDMVNRFSPDEGPIIGSSISDIESWIGEYGKYIPGAKTGVGTGGFAREGLGSIGRVERATDIEYEGLGHEFGRDIRATTHGIGATGAAGSGIARSRMEDLWSSYVLDRQAVALEGEEARQGVYEGIGEQIEEGFGMLTGMDTTAFDWGDGALQSEGIEGLFSDPTFFDQDTDVGMWTLGLDGSEYQSLTACAQAAVDAEYASSQSEAMQYCESQEGV